MISCSLDTILTQDLIDYYNNEVSGHDLEYASREDVIGALTNGNTNPPKIIGELVNLLFDQDTQTWKQLDQEVIDQINNTQKEEPEQDPDPFAGEDDKAKNEALTAMEEAGEKFIKDSFTRNIYIDHFNDYVFEKCIYDYKKNISPLSNANTSISEILTQYKIDLLYKVCDDFELDRNFNTNGDDQLTEVINNTLLTVHNKLKNLSLNELNKKYNIENYYLLLNFNNLLKRLTIVDIDPQLSKYMHSHNMYTLSFGKDVTRANFMDDSQIDIDDVANPFMKAFMQYLPAGNNTSLQKIGWNGFISTICAFKNWLNVAVLRGELVTKDKYISALKGDIKAIHELLGKFQQNKSGSRYLKSISSGIITSLQEYVFNPESPLLNQFKDAFVSQFLKTEQITYIKYVNDPIDNALTFEVVENKMVQSESSEITNLLAATIADYKDNPTKFHNLARDLQLTISGSNVQFEFDQNTITLNAEKLGKTNIIRFTLGNSGNLDTLGTVKLISKIFGNPLSLPMNDSENLDVLIKEIAGANTNRTLLDFCSSLIGIALTASKPSEAAQIITHPGYSWDATKDTIYQSYVFNDNYIDLRYYFKEYDDLAKLLYWIKGYDNRNVVQDVNNNKVPLFAQTSLVYKLPQLILDKKGNIIFEGNPFVSGIMIPKGTFIRDGISNSAGQKKARALSQTDLFVMQCFIDFYKAFNSKTVEGENSKITATNKYLENGKRTSKTVFMQPVVFESKSRHFVQAIELSTEIVSAIQGILNNTDENDTNTRVFGINTFNTLITNWQRTKYFNRLDHTISKFRKAFPSLKIPELISPDAFGLQENALETKWAEVVETINKINSTIQTGINNLMLPDDSRDLKQFLRDSFRAAGQALDEDLDYEITKKGITLNSSLLHNLATFSTKESTANYMKLQEARLISNIFDNNCVIYNSDVKLGNEINDYIQNDIILPARIYELSELDDKGKRKRIKEVSLYDKDGNSVVGKQLIINGKLNPKYEIDMNPIIQAWNYTGSMYSNAYDECVHGFIENNPNKSSDDVPEHVMSSRLLGQEKRNSVDGATVASLDPSAYDGVPEYAQIAVIDDLFTPYAYNNTGEKRFEDPHDGGGWESPIWKIWEQNSYTNAKDDIERSKTIFADVDEYGNGRLLKWNSFALTNMLRRVSPDCNYFSGERMFSLMHNAQVDGLSTWYISDFINIKDNKVYVKEPALDGKVFLLTEAEVQNGKIKATYVEVVKPNEDRQPIIRTKYFDTTIYGIDQLFGGAYCMENTSQGFQYSNNNNLYTAKILSELKEKEKVIAYVVNKSACKRGRSNSNPASIINNHDKNFNLSATLWTMRMRTTLGGLMLATDHDVDGDVREPSQLISALTQLGFAEESANLIYRDISHIIKTSLKHIYENNDINTLDEDTIRKMVQDKVLESFNSDSASVGNSFALSRIGMNESISFSNPDIKNKVISAINSTLTNNIVIRRYPGGQMVNAPSVGIIMYFTDNNGDPHSYESYCRYLYHNIQNKKGYLEALTSDDFDGDIDTQFEKAISNAINNSLLDTDGKPRNPYITPIRRKDLKVGDTILVVSTDPEGKIIEKKVYLHTAFEVDEWKHFRKDYDHLYLWKTQPKDLKQPYLSWTIKGDSHTYTEWDLDSVRAMSYLREFLDNKKDPNKVKYWDQKKEVLDDVCRDVFNHDSYMRDCFIKIINLIKPTGYEDYTNNTRPAFATKTFDDYVNFIRTNVIEAIKTNSTLNSRRDYLIKNITNSILKIEAEGLQKYHQEELVELDKAAKGRISTYRFLNYRASRVAFNNENGGNIFDALDNIQVDQVEGFTSNILRRVWGLGTTWSSEQITSTFRSSDESIIANWVARAREDVSNIFDAIKWANLCPDYMQEVDKIAFISKTLFALDFTQEQINIVLANRGNNTITINSASIEPGEIAMSAVFAEKFGIKDGDDLGDILHKGPDFFIRRMTSSVHPDLNGKNYDIVYTTNEGKRIIVKVLNNGETMDNTATSKDIDIKVTKAFLYGTPICNKSDIGSKINIYALKTKNTKAAGYDYITVDSIETLKSLEESGLFNLDLTQYNFTDSNKSYLWGYLKHSFEKPDGSYKLKNGKVYTTELPLTKDLQDYFESEYNHAIKNRARDLYTAFLETLYSIGTRIPSQAMQSFMKLKIKLFVGFNSNQIYIPGGMHWFQGADFDVDKTFLMRLGLLDYRVDSGSNLARKYGIRETAKLPFPDKNESHEVRGLPLDATTNGLANQISSGAIFRDRQHYTKLSLLTSKEDTIKVIRDIIANTREHPDLGVVINVINDIPTATEEVNLAAAKELLNDINTHNRTNLSNKSRLNNALRTRTVLNTEAALELPSTFICQSIPISFGEIQDIAKESPLGGVEKNLSLWNVFSNIIMQVQFALGKDEIGIVATAIKTYLGKNSVVNHAIKSAVNDLKSGYTTSGLEKISQYIFTHKFLVSDELTGEKNFTRSYPCLLANINLRDLKEFRDNLVAINGRKLLSVTPDALQTKAYKIWGIVENGTPYIDLDRMIDELSYRNAEEDVLLALSALLSAATDHAKELILSKINASQNTVDLFCCLLGTGYSIKEVLNIFSSEAFSLLELFSRQNLITGTRSSSDLKKIVNFLLNRGTLLSPNQERNFYSLFENKDFLYETKTDDKGNETQKWRFDESSESAYLDILKQQEILSKPDIPKDRRDELTQKLHETKQNFIFSILLNLDNIENYEKVLTFINEQIDKKLTRPKRKRKGYTEEEDFADLGYEDDQEDLDQLESSEPGFEEPEFDEFNEEPDYDAGEEGEVRQAPIELRIKQLKEYTLSEFRSFRKFILDLRFKHIYDKSITASEKDLNFIVDVADDIAKENHILGIIMRINQGLPKDLNELYSYIKSIESYINQRTGTTYDIFNLKSFIDDALYRDEWIEKYEAKKKQTNILRVISNLPNFWDMFATLSTSTDWVKNQYIARKSFELADKFCEDVLGSRIKNKLSVDEFRALESLITDTINFGFLGMLRNTKIEVPKGHQYYVDETNEGTSNITKRNTYMGDTPLVLSINTGNGAATFKYLTEQIFFSLLQGDFSSIYESNLSEEDKAKLVETLENAFKNNAFINSLVNDSTYIKHLNKHRRQIKANISMTQKDNSKVLSAEFSSIKEGFDKIANIRIPYLGQELKIGDIIFLYNLITNRASPTDKSFSSLFNNFSQDNPECLYRAWDNFMVQLDQNKMDVMWNTDRIFADLLCRLSKFEESRERINAKTKKDEIPIYTPHIRTDGKDIQDGWVIYFKGKKVIYSIEDQNWSDNTFNLPVTTETVLHTVTLGDSHRNVYISDSQLNIRFIEMLNKLVSPDNKDSLLVITTPDNINTNLPEKLQQALREMDTIVYDGKLYVNSANIKAETSSRILINVLNAALLSDESTRIIWSNFLDKLVSDSQEYKRVLSNIVFSKWATNEDKQLMVYQALAQEFIRNNFSSRVFKDTTWIGDVTTILTKKLKRMFGIDEVDPYVLNQSSIEGIFKAVGVLSRTPHNVSGIRNTIITNAKEKTHINQYISQLMLMGYLKIEGDC